MKVIIYADTVREGRKFYPSRSGQEIGYRVAGEFNGVEKCDMVMYAKDYPDIEKAYDEKPKDKKKK